jgi:polar amino acid transport system permease protein
MDRLLDAFFNRAILVASAPALFSGLWVTVQVAICTVVGGLLAGFALALLRCLRIRPLDWLIIAWTDMFRAAPQLVVIVYVYFALPYAGISVSPFAATAGALGAVLSAFVGEIVWAAINAVPAGQWDAARAVGLRPWTTLRRVILPQAIRLATPLIANRAIGIVKGTALGTAVALPELLGEAQSKTSLLANPSPLMLAAVLYVLLFVPLVVASRWIERRAAVSAR